MEIIQNCFEDYNFPCKSCCTFERQLSASVSVLFFLSSATEFMPFTINMFHFRFWETDHDDENDYNDDKAYVDVEVY